MTQAGETIAAQILSRFTCTLDKDVEIFLRNSALQYEKSHISRTYLFWNAEEVQTLDEVQIYAFFTLSPKTFTFTQDLSVSKRKKLSSFFYKSNDAVGYLIGQLGKNTAIPENQNPIHMQDILENIFAKVYLVHTHIGGRFMFLDCKESNSKIFALYQKHGFIPFSNVTLGKNISYHRMVRLM